jgi:PKD repeat protein
MRKYVLRMHVSVILFFVMAAFFVSAEDAGTHYLRADVTNNLKDNANCPGWTDKLQWAIKSGECESGGAFTPVACSNDQTKTIMPGETVRSAKCELTELPAGNYNIYCIRVIWCQKEPRVRGLFKLNNDVVTPAENKPPVASLKVGFEFYDTSKEASALAGGGEMGFWAGDSKDPDGTISSYKWDYGDGQKEETKELEVHHGYASPGTYAASLVVVDDKGVASAQDTAKITVVKLPVTQAYAGTKQDDINYKEVTVKPGETVYFDGSRSASVKGIAGYVWVYASAEQGTLLSDYLNNPVQTTLDTDKSAKPSRSFTCNDKECDYSAVLLIDEGEGLKKDSNLRDAVLVKVVRDPANSPIKAIAYVGAKKDDLKYSSVKVNYGEPLYYVDKSTSTSAITSRLWYYPDLKQNAKAVKDEVEEVTYELPGTYTLQLFIEDEKNEKDNTEVSVEVVSSADNKPPVAAIKAYYYNYYKEGSSISKINSETYDPKYLEPITIDADKTIHIKKQTGKLLMFSGADSTDPDGQIIAYKWVGDGSDLGTSTYKETFLDFTNLGEHSIELSALDDKGGVGKESLKVIVEDSTEEGAGLDIFFAPSNWKDSDEAFGKFIDSVKDFRKLLAPNCPKKIRLTNAKKECQELPGDFLDDIDKSMLSILDCSNRLGKTFDIIVVVTSNQLTPGLEGLSAGVLPITLISSKSPTTQSIVTIAHESGHQLGLADEYYDSCRCFGKAPNCLDTAIGGSDQAGGFGKQCAGGTECSRGAVCKGNLNSHGGRCIMSAAADISYEPREFCPLCASYLASLPQLKCD